VRQENPISGKTVLKKIQKKQENAKLNSITGAGARRIVAGTTIHSNSTNNWEMSRKKKEENGVREARSAKPLWGKGHAGSLFKKKGGRKVNKKKNTRKNKMSKEEMRPLRQECETCIPNLGGRNARVFGEGGLLLHFIE